MADFPAGQRGPSRGKSSSEQSGEVIGILVVIAIIAWFLYGIGVIISGVWHRDGWQVAEGGLQSLGAAAIFGILAWIGSRDR